MTISQIPQSCCFSRKYRLFLQSSVSEHSLIGYTTFSVQKPSSLEREDMHCIVQFAKGMYFIQVHFLALRIFSAIFCVTISIFIDKWKWPFFCDNPQILSWVPLRLLPNFPNYFNHGSSKKRGGLNTRYSTSPGYSLETSPHSQFSSLSWDLHGLAVYELQCVFTRLSNLVLTKALFLQRETWDSGIWNDWHESPQPRAWFSDDKLCAFPLRLCFWELAPWSIRPTPWSGIPCPPALGIPLAAEDLMGGEGWPYSIYLLLPSARLSAGRSKARKKNACRTEAYGL